MSTALPKSTMVDQPLIIVNLMLLAGQITISITLLAAVQIFAILAPLCPASDPLNHNSKEPVFTAKLAEAAETILSSPSNILPSELHIAPVTLFVCP